MMALLLPIMYSKTSSHDHFHSTYRPRQARPRLQAIADITSDPTTCPKEVKVDTNEKKKKKKSSNDLPVKREWGL